MNEKLKEKNKIEKDDNYEHFDIAKPKKEKSKNRIFTIIFLSILEILIMSFIIILIFKINQRQINSYEKSFESNSKSNNNHLSEEKINYSWKAIFDIRELNESVKLIDPLYINNIKDMFINNEIIKPTSNYIFPYIGNYTITSNFIK